MAIWGWNLTTLTVSNSSPAVVNDHCYVKETNTTSRTFAERVAQGVILLLICVLTMGTNVILWITVIRYKELHKSMYVLLLNLSVSDLLLGVVNMPVVSYTLLAGRWELGCTVCSVVGLIHYMGVGATVISICSVSINRYVRVCREAWYNVIYHKQYMVLHVAGTWGTTIALHMPLALSFESFKFSFTYFNCSYQGKLWNMYIYLVSSIFLVVAVLIFFTNAAIYSRYKKSKIALSRMRPGMEGFKYISILKRHSTGRWGARRKIQREDSRSVKSQDLKLSTIVEKTESSMCVNAAAKDDDAEATADVVHPPPGYDVETPVDPVSLLFHFRDSQEVEIKGTFGLESSTLENKMKGTFGLESSTLENKMIETFGVECSTTVDPSTASNNGRGVDMEMKEVETRCSLRPECSSRVGPAVASGDETGVRTETGSVENVDRAVDIINSEMGDILEVDCFGSPTDSLTGTDFSTEADMDSKVDPGPCFSNTSIAPSCVDGAERTPDDRQSMKTPPSFTSLTSAGKSFMVGPVFLKYSYRRHIRRGTHRQQRFTLEGKPRREDLHVALTLMVVVSVFFIIYIPTTILTVLSSAKLFQLPPNVWIACLILVYSNSMCNPIIYGWGNLNIRNGYKQLLTDMRGLRTSSTVHFESMATKKRANPLRKCRCTRL